MEHSLSILLTVNIIKEEQFVLEASKPAAVETACTKMVAGEQWFVNYKSNLTENTIKNKLFSKRYEIHVW